MARAIHSEAGRPACCARMFAFHATSAGSSISRRIVPLPGFAVCSGQYKRSAAIFRLQPCRWQWCLMAFKHTDVDGVDKTECRSRATLSGYVDTVDTVDGGSKVAGSVGLVPLAPCEGRRSSLPPGGSPGAHNVHALGMGLAAYPSLRNEPIALRPPSSPCVLARRSACSRLPSASSMSATLSTSSLSTSSSSANRDGPR